MTIRAWANPKPTSKDWAKVRLLLLRVLHP
jgi:hypothetical protein